MSTPVGAVTAINPQKGVKRNLPGNPVAVPSQLPGFRGRVVDAGGPVKAPKLRNGNLNNETSNVRIPYSRVCPLEFLSSYTGRLSPGDVVFVSKFPPGFMGRTHTNHNVNNMTLGVNSMTRVVGLDGLNRLLMGSNPEGWKLGLNVMWLNDDRGAAQDLTPGAVSNGGNCAKFQLSVLDEYRLDGVCISNDEPGAFTSSGSRDNAIFNVAVQGPTECNNGFLAYAEERNGEDVPDAYNPLTGVTNARAVEAYARGSVESGKQLDRLEGRGVPGRTGSPWLPSGKTDFVANFTGTYSLYPTQMWDRRLETLSTLYIGLRAYDLSLAAKLLVTDDKGALLFDNDTERASNACMVFYQYMPFSSRVASTIQAVTNQQMVGTHRSPDGARDFKTWDELMALQANDRAGYVQDRIQASKKIKGTMQRSAASDIDAPFDQRTFDPIRTGDLYNMVGAWHVGRVLDTKAARHDPYAGGPGDTAFSCIVDVGISWRTVQTQSLQSSDSEVQADRAPAFGATKFQKAGQQDKQTLTNCAQPHLGGKSGGVIGQDFGCLTTTEQGLGANYCENVTRFMGDGTGLADRAAAERRAAAIKAKRASAMAYAAEENIRLMEELEKEKKNVKQARPQSLIDPELKRLLDGVSGVTEGGVGQTKNPMTPIREIFGSVVQGIRVGPMEATTDATWRSYLAVGIDSAARGTVTSRKKAALENFLSASQTELDQLGAQVRSAMMSNKTVGAGALDTIARKLNEKLDRVSKEIDLVQSFSTERSRTGQATALKGKYLSRIQILVMVLGQAIAVCKTFTQNDYTEVPGVPLLSGSWGNKSFADMVPEEATLELDLMMDSAKRKCVHILALCEVHEEHFEHFGFDMDAAPTAAPTGSKAPARGRSKTPTKRAAVPAAAAGMSATPLVPTSASPVVDAAMAAAATRPAATRPAATRPAASGVASTSASATAAAAAPRRRAREGGESTTNSVFETMFSQASPTAAVPEEPASPTPSSGSDQPSVGPRTFRRGPQR